MLLVMRKRDVQQLLDFNLISIVIIILKYCIAIRIDRSSSNLTIWIDNTLKILMWSLTIY